MVIVTRQLDDSYEVATFYQDGTEYSCYNTLAEALKGLNDGYTYIDLNSDPRVIVRDNGECIIDGVLVDRAIKLATSKQKLDPGCSYSLKVVLTKIENINVGAGI